MNLVHVLAVLPCPLQVLLLGGVPERHPLMASPSSQTWSKFLIQIVGLLCPVALLNVQANQLLSLYGVGALLVRAM